ncbi:hypothetical protein ACJJTC_006308 [Scirpophaga incertulas]
MECTQRLENTQEFFHNKTERVSLEQIGFLGICGEKYPIKTGPNKIGRDPTTCSIVLNLNSISRQHAVINILNQQEFMIMDLDSANKTKLMDKILQPYIPQPLSNGDMVQFGDVFGVFRLLEEDTDLPMTQAIDIPDTPISTKYGSRLMKVPITIVPESPDVSDKDESFIAPSQSKRESCQKSIINFVKPSSKIISIQPIGTKRIDNIYWSSTKKSVSLNSSQLNKSSNGLHDSIVDEEPISKNGEAINNIHEMETQNCMLSKDDLSIYNMETQQFLDSQQDVQTKNTELVISTNMKDKPGDTIKHISIYDMETQSPIKNKNNTSIYETDVQDMKIQYLCENPKLVENAIGYVNTIEQPVKEKSAGIKSIYDMQTQSTIINDTSMQNKYVNKVDTEIIKSTSVTNEADISNELSSQSGVSKENEQDVCQIGKQHEKEVDLFRHDKENENIFTAETQPVLKEDDTVNIQEDLKKISVKILDAEKNLNVSEEEILFEEMDSQNIGDDMFSQPLIIPEEHILVNQNSPEVKNVSLKDEIKVKSVTLASGIIIHSDSSTDCEDIDLLPTQKIQNNKVNDVDDDLTDCEDVLDSKAHGTTTTCFEEMATQVIDEIQITTNSSKTSKSSKFSMEQSNNKRPTQGLIMLEELASEEKENNYHDQLTQVIEDDIVDQSFNVDFKGNKNVDSPFKIPLLSPVKLKKTKEPTDTKENTIVPNTKIISNVNEINENYYDCTQEIVDDLCSQKEKNNENIEFCKSKLTPKKYVLNKSFESNDGDDKFVNNFSSQQVRNVIGVETAVNTIKNTSSSDLSDVESTPKKVRPMKLMDIDLPDSQEIKTNVSSLTRPLVTESSSDSEPENDSEEQFTPILFRKNKKSKKDLLIKFDVDSLPSRVITRVRKPTLKFQIANEELKKNSKNILKPKFLSEQEEDIDKDIINENIARLKNKNKEKLKNNIETKTEHKQSELENVDSKVKENKLNTLGASTHSKDTTLSNITSTVEKANEQIHESKKRNNNKKPVKRESKRKEVVSKKEIKVLSVNKIEGNVNTDSSNITDSKIRTLATRNRRNAEKKDKDINIKNKNNSKNDLGKSELVIDLTIDRMSDVRRSERVRNSRNKKDNNCAEIMKENSIIPVINKLDKHEQSAVYNVSSESVPGSPKSLKRSATVELDYMKPKRTRSLISNNKSITPTPANVIETQHVLFTAFPSEEVRAKLDKLGALIVSDVANCTVVLTMQIKRTFKLLCAVGLGRPIVGPSWVQACVDSNFIVDPWPYILKDEIAEKRFQFNLERVLKGKRNFLKGFNVSSTPSVMPDATEMKMIVECSGGAWREGGQQWVCVSCHKDRALWPALRRRGAILLSTEFILGGVLRQRSDLSANKL